jgi:hypothetical protein
MERSTNLRFPAAFFNIRPRTRTVTVSKIVFHRTCRSRFVAEIFCGVGIFLEGKNHRPVELGMEAYGYGGPVILSPREHTFACTHQEGGRETLVRAWE